MLAPSGMSATASAKVSRTLLCILGNVLPLAVERTLGAATRLRQHQAGGHSAAHVWRKLLSVRKNVEAKDGDCFVSRRTDDLRDRRSFAGSSRRYSAPGNAAG